MTTAPRVEPRPPEPAPRASFARLFGVSLLVLLLEMAVIRWTTAQFRVLAYCGNTVLLACFLGLGLGLLAPRRWPRLFAAFPGMLLVLVVAILALHAGRPHFSWDSSLWLWQQSESPDKVYVPLPVLVVPVVAAIAALFVPLGQQMALAFEGLPALRAYTWNILGSLAGVALQGLLSRLALPSSVWFGAAGVCYLVLAAPLLPRAALGLALACLSITAGILGWDDDRYLWSPYYKIEQATFRIHSPPGADGASAAAEVGFHLYVNEDYHQDAVDLREATVARFPDLKFYRMVYDAPYKLHAPPGRVLVLGAGTGNDVAAALRAGAESVDAVEIDPAIRRLGDGHPERPYADPRVTVILDDARSYLQRSRKTYDLIVFGYLDSHSLLSSMSSVRLDNFVYTVDCFRRVRDRLAPGGGVTVTFFVGGSWLDDRLYWMLAEAFGRVPAMAHFDAGRNQAIYFVGERKPQNPRPEPAAGTVPLPTDDWPFLYLRERGIPSDYLWILALVGIGTVACVRGAGAGLRPGWLHFGALGAGFMLVETRSITALALLFGSTWVVNAFVIAGILCAILAANFAAARVAVPVRAVYLLLGATLVAGIVLPPSAFLALGGVAGQGLGTLVYCLPILFAGLLFADGFRRTPQPVASLGANLAGSVLGGLAENLSMWIGLRSLLWVALAFYALSFVGRRRLFEVDSAP